MSDQVKMTPLNYSADRPKAKNPVKIMDLSLRDGHQSLFATRGRTEDMIPVAELMDEVGFWAIETWGGATFDVSMRFLKEDPWQRLHKLSELIPNILFQMLLRGSNAVGYTNYPDNVVQHFVHQAASAGIDDCAVFINTPATNTTNTSAPTLPTAWPMKYTLTAVNA